MDIQWLSKQLERPGLSQSGLAKVLGKSPSAVSRILSGERQIKAAEVPVILRYLGEASFPPSDDDYLSHHAALGWAVSEWNTIENQLSFVLLEAFPPMSEKAGKMVLLLCRSIREYPQRLEVLDRILSEQLKKHPNELAGWRGLLVKIRAAGERRDMYAHSITVPKETGEVVGFQPTRPTDELTVQQLSEDALHFQKLWQEVIELEETLKKLKS